MVCNEADFNVSLRVYLERPRNPKESIRRADPRVKIRNRDLLNKKQDCQPLDCYVLRNSWKKKENIFIARQFFAISTVPAGKYDKTTNDTL